MDHFSGSRPSWYKGLELHRENDLPATQSFDEETGICIFERYVINGVPYRDPEKGPELIERDALSGEITHVEFSNNANEGPGGVDPAP